MPTGCSSAVRMDREVDSDELALMLPTNSGLVEVVLAEGSIASTSMTFDGVAREGGGREEVRGVWDVVP